MHVVCFRLVQGQDLKKEIRKYCQENQVWAAVILSVVGTLSRVQVRLPSGAEAIYGGEKEDGRSAFMITGFVGTCGKGTDTKQDTSLHLQMSFADLDGSVKGGHVRYGCVIDKTAEVVLGVLPDLLFERELDSGTQFKELVVKSINANTTGFFHRAISMDMSGTFKSDI